MKNTKKKQEKKTIKGFQLRLLNNDLYMDFMRSVDSFVTKATPLALGITDCNQRFQQALKVADEAKKQRAKHPLTAELNNLNKIRKARFRCLKGHVWADLDNEDSELREHARILRDKIESYGDVMRIGRHALSARLGDMGRDLSEPPFAEPVAKLGQTANLNAMIAANNACMEISDERRESIKNVVPKAFIKARAALDKAYRELVAAVNAQIDASRLVDNSNITNLAELEDFAKIINELIRSYRTTMKQSGPDKKKDADDTEDAAPKK